jgi:thiol:disulfide interchange protein
MPTLHARPTLHRSSHPNQEPAHAMPRTLRWLAALLLACLVALPGWQAPALAQSAGKGLSDEFALKAPGAADAPKVTVRVVSDATTLAPGDNAVLAVEFDIAQGWKINTNDPVIPPSWGEFPAYPTSITVEGKGVRVGKVQWPASETVNIDLVLSGKPEPFGVFKDGAIAFVPLLVEDNVASPGEITITVSVGYQACDDRSCERPETETFTIPLKIGGAAQRTPSDIFTTFDASAFARLNAGETGDNTPGRKASGSLLVINDFGLNLRINTAGFGFAIVLLIAAVGGFLLNLMPCVLPVIPIKIIGLQKSAGTARRRILLGLIMSLGVVSFWLLVGGVLGYSNRFVAGSQLFSLWWFALGVGVFIFCMGLGMLGVFDVGLPNWVYTLNPKHDSVGGSFGFGVLTAVLALPCVAPFMGTAMSWALGRSFGVTIATFGAIGVGMALPYAILSIAPKLVAWLPRTGPASELLKQVMGLLMVAVSIFFLATGLSSLTKSMPYLSEVLHWWMIALIVLCASGWLAFRTFGITKSSLRRGAFTVLALLMFAATSFWAWVQTDTAYRSHVWRDFDPARFAAAKAEGKIVVLDFTADWCLNCKTLKATVLTTDRMIEVITQPDVVPMKVDLTAEDAPGWELLRYYGQTGIPLLVVERPGLAEPWKSNAYTLANVLEAMGKPAS